MILKHSFSLASLSLISFLSFSQVVPQGFEVFTVNAPIDNTTSVISEIGSALDSDNKVHVAYIERTTGNAPKLRYFVYNDGAISNHTTIEIPNTPAQVLNPVIEVDNNDNPHIVVIVKREATTNTRSGNFGVYYAGSVDGGVSFSVSQVSTNPENPLTDDENMFNCYVNGRPKIRIIENEPWVYYFSDFFINKHYVIFAKKNGTSWDRFQEFTYNQTNFNEPSVDFDASFIPSSLGNIVAWNDFGNYVPKYAIKVSGVWQITNMPDYSGTFANRSVSLSSTNDGETHMIFKNELGDFDKFIHIKINNVGDFEEVNRFEFDFLTGGNIFPSTVDPVTKKPFAFAKKSFSDSGYLYTLDDNNEELRLEFQVGNSPGQYTLDANNGYVAMVTAGFDDDKIYITTGNVGGAATALTSNFTGNSTSIAVNGEVTYSFSGEGTPTSYEWAFQDGTPSTSSAASPVVKYATAGLFDVTLKVTDVGGASDIETKADYITVTQAASTTVSLVSYYSFEAGSLDDKKGNSDLTSVGGGFAAGVDEVANSAYNLGKNDYLKMPPALLDGKTDFSISLWTKITALNASTADPIHSILSAANSTKDNEVLFKYEPAGALLCPDNSMSVTYKGEFGPAGSNDPNCAELNEAFDPLKWHHVVLAKSGGSTRIYLDKMEVASFTHIATALDVDGLLIGQDQDAVLGGFNPDQSLNGLVDEIYLFNGAITAAQVDSLYSLKSSFVEVLTADFGTSDVTVVKGDKVTFTDKSTSSPTSWAWTFEGGTPATSTVQNPEITYNAIGEFDVRLIVTKGTEKDTLERSGHIVVTETDTDPGTDVTEITEAWAKYIPEEGNTNGFVDIALDNVGNLYTAGVSVKGSGNTAVESVVVLKANSDGEQTYYKTIANNGYQYHEDYVSEIDVDNSGNVYLATSLQKLVGGSIPDDYFLISLDAQGTERWRVAHDNYNFGYYSSQWDNKLAILNSGYAPSGPGTNIAHMTIFNTSNGTVASSTPLNMSAGNIDIGRYYDLYGSYRTETRLDQRNGDVVFGVTHAGTGANGRDIQLRKVSAGGGVWEKKLDSERSLSQDELISIKSDASGNVYVLARMINSQGVNIMSLFKLNNTLNQLWKVDFVPEGSGMDATSMDFDSEGNVVVSGVDNVYPFVAMVNPAGVKLWSKVLDELSVAFWRGYKVMVASSNKLILAANKSGVTSAPMSFILLSKEGNILQTFQNESEASQEHFVNRVAFDKSKNAVFICGWARDDNSVKSLFYAKYVFPETFAQTLTFEELTDVVETVGEIELAAEASSGLPVAFTVEGPATIEGTTLIITGPGQVTITATQPGNDDYVAAEGVSYTFCVLPATPEITSEETSEGVLLTSSAEEGNVWYFDGEEIEDADESAYLATKSGAYEVKVVVDGCESSMSDEQEVTISPVLGLPDVSTNQGLKLYPNPVAGVLYVEGTSDDAIQSVAVYSVTGVEVLYSKEKINKGTNWEINATSLVPGIYLLKISTISGEYSSRFIKQY